MDNPFAYPLCNQTVTVYRRDGFRQVIPGCYYRWEQAAAERTEGIRLVTKFLLILPGDTCALRPGDRVFDGVGPEQVDWEEFLPAQVPGLGEVAYVTPWYWEGKLCHREAGRK